MVEEIVKKMDELIFEDDETKFEEKMDELKRLVINGSCSYTKGLFSAIENIIYGKQLAEKKNFIKIYKKTYQELEI